MGKYKLIFKKSVLKDLRSIPRKDVVRIVRRLDELMNDPRPPGSEKLSDQERYRLRQGLYRIIYEINDDFVMVLVVKVGHRREIYRT
jgi:mRNA interferase RelE/StbE